MMADPTYKKCSISDDGLRVEACKLLVQAAEGLSQQHRKGIVIWHYESLMHPAASRAFFGAKTRSHTNGIIFNFCPFCGEAIDGPAMAQRDDKKEAE